MTLVNDATHIDVEALRPRDLPLSKQGSPRGLALDFLVVIDNALFERISVVDQMCRESNRRRRINTLVEGENFVLQDCTIARLPVDFEAYNADQLLVFVPDGEQFDLTIDMFFPGLLGVQRGVHVDDTRNVVRRFTAGARTPMHSRKIDCESLFVEVSPSFNLIHPLYCACKNGRVITLALQLKVNSRRNLHLYGFQDYLQLLLALGPSWTAQ